MEFYCVNCVLLQTYGVVTSYPEVMKKVMRIQGDEKEAETIERGERITY